MFNQKKDPRNISLDAKIQVDLEDIKRHMVHKDQPDEMSLTESKSNNSGEEEIILEEKRKMTLRKSLVERFRNMSINKNKEYEILNEQKYRDFVEEKGDRFERFLNHAADQLLKEIN